MFLDVFSLLLLPSQAKEHNGKAIIKAKAFTVETFLILYFYSTEQLLSKELGSYFFNFQFMETNTTKFSISDSTAVSYIPTDTSHKKNRLLFVHLQNIDFEFRFSKEITFSYSYMFTQPGIIDNKGKKI
jgi:hypothetical protein